MGLDMFLEKSVYIGAEYDFNNVTGTVEIYKDGKLVPINFNKITSVREEFMYWRKANAIHNWFVQHVQHGEDNCAEYYVDTTKLKELVSTCKKVLRNHNLADELLPTQSGFFFGNTDYDEYYFNQLRVTVDALKDIDENASYYYSSSW